MPDEGTPETLRQRLINAELVDYTEPFGGYQFTRQRSNETASGVALAVFRDWLRAQAAVTRQGIIWRRGHPELLEELADAIDKELNTDG